MKFLDQTIFKIFKSKKGISMKQKNYLFIFSIMIGSLMGNETHNSWISPKLELRSSTVNGFGLFTKDKIHKDERIAVFGGTIGTKEDVFALSYDECVHNVVQIDTDLWLINTPEILDYLNHSCNPNVGFYGQIMLVAMRDIQADEEITCDYAMVVSEFVGMKNFECLCGATDCRKIMSEDDWKKKDLQEKYKGYFSAYLEKIIKN